MESTPDEEHEEFPEFWTPTEEDLAWLDAELDWSATEGYYEDPDEDLTVDEFDEMFEKGEDIDN